MRPGPVSSSLIGDMVCDMGTLVAGDNMTKLIIIHITALFIRYQLKAKNILRFTASVMNLKQPSAKFLIENPLIE